MKEFECKRGSFTIRGRILGDTTEKREVVILSHGFMSDQNGCMDFARVIEEAGLIAVTFDFCGGGPNCVSDGSTRDMTVFTEVEDLLAVIEYFRNQPFTAGISILGFSQGGLVSALVAEKADVAINRLILVFPALCIPDDARAGRMLGFGFDPENIPETLGQEPMLLCGDYARSVIHLDVYKELGKFAGPVLYLHGTADPIVNISYARRAHSLYSNCEYHEIQEGGHGFWGEAEMEARGLLRDFLKK